MANITDVVEKLIQLATHNPDPEEARSAALKAVQLIEKYSIPIGADDVTVVRAEPEYRPPTAEEEATIADLLGRKKGSSGGGYNPDDQQQWNARHPKDPGLITQDASPMTAADAFRQRLIDAWRALREERIRLREEIRRYEQESRRTYRPGDRPDWTY